jgi:hypothetical protein
MATSIDGEGWTVVPRDDPATSKLPSQARATDEVVQGETPGIQSHPPSDSAMSSQAPASPAVNSADVANLHDLQTRLKIFGSVLLAVVIDVGFLVAWVVIQQLLHYAVKLLGELSGMTEALLRGMEYLFDGAMFVVVAAYVVRDVWVSVCRIWRSK